MKTIRVVDHAPAPGGRFVVDGDYSGEWFRDQILVPELKAALAAGDKVEIKLDGAPGYGSSFLEEAFGGLIRTGAFTNKDLELALVVSAERPLYQPYKKLVERYIREARRRPQAA